MTHYPEISFAIPTNKRCPPGSDGKMVCQNAGADCTWRRETLPTAKIHKKATCSLKPNRGFRPITADQLTSYVTENPNNNIRVSYRGENGKLRYEKIKPTQIQPYYRSYLTQQSRQPPPSQFRVQQMQPAQAKFFQKGRPSDEEYKLLKEKYESESSLDARRLLDYKKCLEADEDEIRYHLRGGADEFYPQLPAQYYRNKQTMCATIPLINAIEFGNLRELEDEAQEKGVGSLYNELMNEFYSEEKKTKKPRHRVASTKGRPNDEEYQSLKEQFKAKDDADPEFLSNYDNCIGSDEDEVRYKLRRTADGFYPQLEPKYYENKETMCRTIPLIETLALEPEDLLKEEDYAKAYGLEDLFKKLTDYYPVSE